MISQGDRVVAAKAVRAARDFGFPMALDPVGSDGFRPVVVRAPNRPEVVVGRYRDGEAYKGVIISPGFFEGTDGGVFEGKLLEGAMETDVETHWSQIEKNLYYWVDAWLGLLPAI